MKTVARFRVSAENLDGLNERAQRTANVLIGEAPVRSREIELDIAPLVHTAQSETPARWEAEVEVRMDVVE